MQDQIAQEKNDSKVTSMKVTCLRCGFLVNPVDHVSRCKIGGHSERSEFDYRSWIGDAVHALDVRRVFELLETKGAAEFKTPAERHGAYQKYTSSKGQREYIETVNLQNPDISDKRMATEFETLYTGEFRRNYLKSVFNLTEHEIDFKINM